MEDQIATKDLYEAAWYYLNGCRIEGIQCLEMDEKRPACFFSFRSDAVPPLQKAYLRQEAQVNLWQFRRAYAQLRDYVADAKKQFARRQRLEGGAK